jgi:hypothetical protein
VTAAAWYAAVLHVASLAALVVLVALGKITWAEGGPVITGLVGIGVALPAVVPGLSYTTRGPASPLAPPKASTP